MTALNDAEFILEFKEGTQMVDVKKCLEMKREVRNQTEEENTTVSYVAGNNKVETD